MAIRLNVVYEHVTKKFGDVAAVDDLSLEVKSGEFLILLGPSGCGKTTTIRLTAGLETPTSGRIRIGDRVVNELPPRDRNVAMVFQDYALYPHMTVHQNIAFPLRVRKMSRDEINERVHKVAAMLRITELLDRKPKEISGGQAQRVALGRAMVREPDVFLLDEPLSNIDAKLRIEMRAELVKLQRELGTTTIYVTHDQEEAMTIGHRIVIMNKGIVQQVGSPLEVYDRPKSTFVARFIGSPAMNMFEGNVKEKDGELAIDAGAFACSVPQSVVNTIRERNVSEVMVGVRPEDITIIRERIPDSIEAKIDVVEPVGSDTYLYLDAGGVSLIARTNPHFDLTIGEKVWLLLHKERFHLFDKKDSCRIDQSASCYRQYD
jgi:multiple sugar transport system ATP-binding protein